MANPETAAIVKAALAAATTGGAMGAMLKKDDKPEGQNAMGDFFMMMRLTDLIKMAGRAVPAGAKRELNEALTKIKKN